MVGLATWYCLPGVSRCPWIAQSGPYAAAGPAIRIGNWRGRWVTVCQGTLCIRVKLIDWCACPGGHTIDLFGDVFERFAPLSRGVLRVVVIW